MENDEAIQMEQLRKAAKVPVDNPSDVSSGFPVNKPRLFVAYVHGILQIMRNENDPSMEILRNLKKDHFRPHRHKISQLYVNLC